MKVRLFKQLLADGFELFDALVAEHDFLLLAVLESDDRRHPPDGKAGAQFAVLVNVNFDDLDLACIFACDLLEIRCQHLAGAAPGRVEIDDHWNLGFFDFLLEAFGADLLDLQRLVYWRIAFENNVAGKAEKHDDCQADKQGFREGDGGFEHFSYYFLAPDMVRAASFNTWDSWSLIEQQAA